MSKETSTKPKGNGGHIFVVNFVLVLAFGLSLCSFSFSDRATPTGKFHQLLVADQLVRSDVLKIDEELRNVPGVVTSRTDVSTRMCLVFVERGIEIEAEEIEELITNLGYNIRCSYEGQHGVDRMIRRQEFTCN